MCVCVCERGWLSFCGLFHEWYSDVDNTVYQIVKTKLLMFRKKGHSYRGK